MITDYIEIDKMAAHIINDDLQMKKISTKDVPKAQKKPAS